jgi:hypothetical protein
MNKKHIFRKTFLDFIANGIEEIEYFDKKKKKWIRIWKKA